MDKIDLDAIAMKFIEVRPHHTKLMIARAVAKEAINQTLVLASENAKTIIIPEEYDYISVDKQSILDIGKLIV